MALERTVLLTSKQHELLIKVQAAYLLQYGEKLKLRDLVYTALSGFVTLKELKIND